MEAIPNPPRLSGLPPEFGEREYGRLRALNAQLVHAEQWIDRRSHEMVTAYGLAAAQARHDERLDEDVELIATVLFLLPQDHPEFVPGGHNLVTRIDIPILPASGMGADSSCADARTAAQPDDCGHWCSLFMDLYERALQRDAMKLLNIGALCIDIALIQQQLRSW